MIKISSEKIREIYCREGENMMKIDGEFSAFSIPYVIPTIKKPKEIYKLLYVIPFSLIYFPIYSITAIIGFAIGIARYRSLERGGRAW